MIGLAHNKTVALGRVTPRIPVLRLSENARRVLESRYLKKDEKGDVTEAPEDLFLRVARVVAQVERTYDDTVHESFVEDLTNRFYNFMVEGYFMPNSPTLMNAGREMGMLSACFVLPVDDSIDGIFNSIKHTALIQKAGGGTGFDFSRLRPAGDYVRSSGGRTSGPMSFLKVFSEATNSIQQGAFRRGANMGMMRIDHPDIIEFITAKDDLSRFTNYNFSVSVTDAFVERLRQEPQAIHFVMNPRTGQSFPLRNRHAPAGAQGDDRYWRVGQVWDLIVTRAHATGEPGVIFIDRINAANPTPKLGRMEATNPCGEQPLLPFEACNLGSINVAKFVHDADTVPRFDWPGYAEMVHLATRYLDNVIDANNYPLPEIDRVCKANRKIGLGIMGFADACFLMGLRYDTEEAVNFGGKLMQVLNDEAHAYSEALAGERGSFPNWEGSTWDTVHHRPMRNACTTTVAPTGTISIIAGCSGGIEPLFSLAFVRNVLDGQKLIEVNPIFEAAARRRGCYSPELMEQVAAEGSIQHRGELPADLRRVFVCAHDIAPEWHVRMQATYQEHTDASISKTTNFPHDATPDDVRRIYDLAFDLGCKGVTVYRDGCRQNQPMALKNEGQTAPAAPAPAVAPAAPTRLVPVKVPEIMPSLRIRQYTPFGNMHVKIAMDPQTGREREVFAQLGKGGDLASSDLEAVCRMISLFLRCNGALEDVLNQLEGIGSSMTVAGRDGRVMSLADGLAKAIAKYLKAKERFGLHDLLLGVVPDDKLAGLSDDLRRGEAAPRHRSHDTSTQYKLKCPECDAVLAFEEGCMKCHGCGFSKC